MYKILHRDEVLPFLLIGGNGLLSIISNERLKLVLNEDSLISSVESLESSDKFT